MHELLDIIDENDNVICTMTREEAYKINATVRISGVLVFTTSNKIILQQRSKNKTYPLCFDYSAAGHVLSGQNYKQAAIEELKEELGIVIDNLVHVGIVKTYNIRKSNKPRKLHHVFMGIHNGPFNIFEKELSGVIEVGEEELHNTINKKPDLFTPNFIQIYNEVIIKGNLFRINKNIIS